MELSIGAEKVDLVDKDTGKRKYIDIYDDHSVPFLHWGDGYGFIMRSDLDKLNLVVKPISK